MKTKRVSRFVYRYVVGPFVFTITEIPAERIADEGYRLNVKDRRTGGRKTIGEYETQSGADGGIVCWLRDMTKSPKPEWLSYEGFAKIPNYPTSLFKKAV